MPISDALLASIIPRPTGLRAQNTSGGIGAGGPLSLGGGGISGGGSSLFSSPSSLGAFASASRKSTTGFAGGTSYFSPSTQMAINNLLKAGDLAASLEQLNALITAALNKSSSSDWNLNGLPGLKTYASAASSFAPPTSAAPAAPSISPSPSPGPSIEPIPSPAPALPSLEPAPAPAPSPSPEPAPSPSPSPAPSLPVSGAEPAIETPPPSSILDDPAIKSIVQRMKDNPSDIPFLTGTSVVGINGTFNAYSKVYEGPDGKIHSVVTLDQRWFDNTMPYSQVQIIDGEKVNTSGSAFIEADAAPTLEVMSPDGTVSTLHSVFDVNVNNTDIWGIKTSGGVDQVEINGAATDAAGLVQWAKDNNLDQKTYTNGIYTTREYWADVKTDYGVKQIIVATEVNGQAMNRQQYMHEKDYIVSSNSFMTGNDNYSDLRVTDISGTGYNIVSRRNPGNYQQEYLVDGKSMTTSEFTDWAGKTANFDKTTFTLNGHTVDEYWARQDMGGDTRGVKLATIVDGALYGGAYRGNSALESTKTMKDMDGNKYEYTQQNFYFGTADGAAKTTIVDGKPMSDAQLLDWAKTKNFEKRNYSIDGHNITEYWNSNPDILRPGDTRKPIAVEADGAVATQNTSYRYEQGFAYNGSGFSVYDTNVEIVNKTGERFTLGQALYGSASLGAATAGAYIDNVKMDASQIVEWAKANNFNSQTVEVNGRSITTYISSNNITDRGFNIDVTNSFAAEIDGKAFFQTEYLQDPNSIRTTSSIEVVNKAGERFQFNEAMYNIKPTTGDTYGSFVANKWVNAQEYVSWAKEQNLYTRTGTVNGHTVTEYFSKDVSSDIARSERVGNSVIAAEIDGKAFLHTQYRQNPNAFADSRGYSSPIALDLGDKGFSTIGAEQGVNFDLTGSGEAVQTGWVAGDTALLALDRNNNGAIDSGKELFGDQYGAANGYDELAKFDDNKDNVINASDAVFSNLRLWRDSNSDGVSGAGELVSLKDAGVSSLSLNYRQTPDTDAFGNKFAQRSTFTRSDGGLGQSADIWFKFMSTSAYMKQQFNYNG